MKTDDVCDDDDDDDGDLLDNLHGNVIRTNGDKVNNTRFFNDDNFEEVDAHHNDSGGDVHDDDDMHLQPAWLRYLPQQKYIKVINKLPTNDDDITKNLTSNIDEPSIIVDREYDNNAISVPFIASTATTITTIRSGTLTAQKQRKIFSTNPFSPYSQQVMKIENQIRNKKRTATTSSLYDDADGDDNVNRNNNDIKYRHDHHRHHDREGILKVEVVENYCNNNNGDEVYYYHGSGCAGVDNNEGNNSNSNEVKKSSCTGDVDVSGNQSNNSNCHNKTSTTTTNNDNDIGDLSSNYDDDNNNTSTGKYKRQRTTAVTTTTTQATNSSGSYKHHDSDNGYKHKYNINMMEASELFNFINLK